MDPNVMHMLQLLICFLNLFSSIDSPPFISSLTAVYLLKKLVHLSYSFLGSGFF